MYANFGGNMVPKTQRVATRQDGCWVQEGLRQCAADGKIGLGGGGGGGWTWQARAATELDCSPR